MHFLCICDIMQSIRELHGRLSDNLKKDLIMKLKTIEKVTSVIAVSITAVCASPFLAIPAMAIYNVLGIKCATVEAVGNALLSVLSFL